MSKQKRTVDNLVRDALGQEFKETATAMAITSTSGSTRVALGVGRWRICCLDCNIYFAVGISTITAAVPAAAGTGKSHPLAAGAIEYLTVSEGEVNNYIAAICATGDSGYLMLSRQRATGLTE